MTTLKTSSLCPQQLQLLKQSYKLQPPDRNWTALAQQLKIYRNNKQPVCIDTQSWSQQTTLNPFPKTKMFKNKQNTINNQVQMASLQLQSIPHRVPQQQTLLFQSFGKYQPQLQHLPCQYQSDVSDQAWNSQSIQINFQKTLSSLPSPKLIKNRHENTQSIKQFCYRLTQDSTNVMDITPVKRWVDVKRIRQEQRLKQKIQQQTNNMKRVLCQKQPIQQTNVKSQMKKESIRKIIYGFLGQIDQLQPQEVTDDLLSQTKTLISHLSLLPRKTSTPIQRRCQTKLFNDSSEHSPTVRMRTQTAVLNQRRLQTQNRVNNDRSHGKIKVYECLPMKKQKQNTLHPPSTNISKNQARQRRFKF